MSRRTATTPIPVRKLQPLRSLAGARDRVRGMDKNRTQDVVVLFKAGDYFIDETVRFGEQDSGVNGTRVIYRNGDELRQRQSDRRPPRNRMEGRRGGDLQRAA